MKVLNILTSGEAGGIESLCRDIGLNARYENGYCFLFKGGAICDQMKQLGLTVHELYKIGRKLSVRKFNALKKIAQHYDIIVVHNRHALTEIYHYFVAKQLMKKSVVEVHSCYEKERFSKNAFREKIDSYVFQKEMDKADAVIFVSNAGKESFCNVFKIDDKKTKIIYNGIGENKLSIGKITPINRSKPYNLLYVGRLVDVKGVDLLLYAADKLSRDYSISVSIVGDGPDRQRLQEIVKSSGLGDIVTFFGRQVDVVPFYEKSNIFVYPSIWQEVFGISIVEGMAFGRPCVVNRVGGIPEIVQDGLNGYISKSPTADGIYEAIVRAINDIESGNIEKISGQAKRRAEELSIKKTVSELDELFRNL